MQQASQELQQQNISSVQSLSRSPNSLHIHGLQHTRLPWPSQDGQNKHECSCAQEKAMAPHSSTLAWKIPWVEESGGLQSMGSLRVGHDSATSLSLFTFMHWRRKWQPTPVFSPGESQGRGSLMGCRLWGRTESDTRLKRLSSSSSCAHSDLLHAASWPQQL